MTESEELWVTQEAFDRLQAELENLKGPVRSDIVARIAQAREEGDLKENGGYHAARDEQGKIEARIRQLEALLLKAHVGETKPDDGVVEPGMVVTVRFVSDGSEETFLLGSRELLALDDSHSLDVYSPSSPMGQAINLKSRGDRVEYAAPNGSMIAIDIVDSNPFTD